MGSVVHLTSLTVPTPVLAKKSSTSLNRKMNHFRLTLPIPSCYNDRTKTDKRSEKIMAKNKAQVTQRDELPENFDSIEAFWSFWDTHSTADYEDLMEEVEVQFNLREVHEYLPIQPWSPKVSIRFATQPTAF
jgi:hypothetical protein